MANKERSDWVNLNSTIELTKFTSLKLKLFSCCLWVLLMTDTCEQSVQHQPQQHQPQQPTMKETKAKSNCSLLFVSKRDFQEATTILRPSTLAFLVSIE